MTITHWNRPSGFRTIELGELRVSHVPDGSVRLKPLGWLPSSTAADWTAHARHLDADGHLVGSLGALLVEKGDRALLIDTGFGPVSFPDDAGNPGIGAVESGGLLDALAALGRSPADVEAVAFTHMHLDHLGWALHPAPGGTGPAFGHVPYLLAEPEWAGRRVDPAEGITREILDTLAPRVRTAADGEEIFPGVRVSVAEGHTAGHTAYTITSGGRRLIAFGDALHTPVQVAHPAWFAVGDHDRAASGRHRARLVEELRRPDTIGYGGHFADVVFGRVGDVDGRAEWIPE
ncbi:MAG TPA: MBL fold metallo-hydrolase [Phytomonospora sp.]